MFDPKPILFAVGSLLSVLAVMMVLPMLADVAAGNADWQVFAVSAVITLFLGVGLVLTHRGPQSRLGTHQAFVLTAASWLTVALFGALPFMLCQLRLDFTDALFESMSGVTTTGSTILTNLELAPPGILLWRALLQWLGGIGIIVMAIAILPMLRVGGMQLFRTESSDSSEKVLPRAAQVVSAIGVIYVGLTALCAVFLWAAGMTAFDAVAHAMTTIATGGFSTFDDSIGHFDSAGIDLIITVFMLLGALPFALYLQAVRGDQRALFTDSQVIWFLSVAASAVAILTLWQWLANERPLMEAFRQSAFNGVSMLTGTGYSTTNFGQWGGFAVALFFFIMVVGGCAGSTTCGIKIFRFQVIYAAAKAQIGRLMQPHGVYIPLYNHKPIPSETVESVMAFFFLFALSFAVLALGLSSLGLDFLTSMSAAATSIANVGPGLSELVGPATTFADLPAPAKWMMTAGMLVGRLELYAILILFAPSFWRS